MEVCEKNNCDSSASKQSCDASVKHMNRGSISELLRCDSKSCFSLNPFAVVCAFFLNLGDFIFLCLLSWIDVSAGNSLLDYVLSVLTVSVQADKGQRSQTHVF